MQRSRVELPVTFSLRKKIFFLAAVIVSERS